MVIDKIENKRHEKKLKLFMWCAYISIALAIINTALGNLVFTNLVPIALYFQYKKTSKKWGNQFIEWKKQELIFKTREYDITTISIKDIESILIQLDIIEIKTEDENYAINIEDYTDYDKRILLKENFTRLKEEITSSEQIN